MSCWMLERSSRKCLIIWYLVDSRALGQLTFFLIIGLIVVGLGEIFDLTGFFTLFRPYRSRFVGHSWSLYANWRNGSFTWIRSKIGR